MKNKLFCLLLTCMTSTVFAQPITVRNKVNISHIPPEVIEKCKNSSCYILTHEELTRGLQAARKAAIKDYKNSVKQ
jgi:hypothetical protein